MTIPAGSTAGEPAVRWQEQRRYLNAHRRELTDVACRLYPDARRAGRSLLLTRPQWTPAKPIPLGDVTLAWIAAPPLVPVTGREPEAAPMLASHTGTPPVGSYAEAVRALAPPRVFENRSTYRLVQARLAGPYEMGFTSGRYFDTFDVGEAVAHELAATVLGSRRPALVDLPLRALVGDPTDPTRRPTSVAITTLTIRYDQQAKDARFLVHWRDPAKVATNGGMYQVLPVGMFQAARTTADLAQDFDLWRCMAREYSEELLGEPEHADVDYAAWPFFQQLQDACSAGLCRPYCLGIGVDPLTLATDILTATIFDASVFDRLFGDLVEDNAEGRTLTTGVGDQVGLPFVSEEIDRLVSREHTQLAGAAVLDLAWSSRSNLLGR